MVWAFPKVIKMAAHEFTAIISVEDRLPISQSCVIEFDLMHLFIESDLLNKLRISLFQLLSFLD